MFFVFWGEEGDFMGHYRKKNTQITTLKSYILLELCLLFPKFSNIFCSFKLNLVII